MHRLIWKDLTAEYSIHPYPIQNYKLYKPVLISSWHFAAQSESNKTRGANCENSSDKTDIHSVAHVKPTLQYQITMNGIKYVLQTLLFKSKWELKWFLGIIINTNLSDINVLFP